MAKGTVSASRPTKCKRRTKAEMEALRQALYNLVKGDRPATVRHVFYSAVGAKLVPKTENAYKNSVGRQLVWLRRQNRMPYSWLTDSTRWMRKPKTYSSLEAAIVLTAQAYRRSMWDMQDAYVEVWCEKDAVAGILLGETSLWDVPLMVSRGFSSLTYLYEAAETIKDIGKPTFLYYFGDRDPSGVHIDRDIERRLRELAPEAKIHFERVAVTADQVERWNLPTRPTKKTDTRSKGFSGRSVELDTVRGDQLCALVRGCIEQHVNQQALDVLRVAEKSERDILTRLGQCLQGGLIDQGDLEDMIRHAQE